MEDLIENIGEIQPLLDASYPTEPSPSSSHTRPGYEQRKRVNESSQFVFPDHGTFLGMKIPDEADLPPLDNPITVALDKCKRLVLQPYLRLLILNAWQPLFEDPSATWQKFLNVIHPVIVTLLILCGYIIQYAGCFRRDQAGQGYEPDVPWSPVSNITNTTAGPFVIGCDNFIISQYVIPNILHSIAYFYSFYVFRVALSEQLPTLMERVFLQTSPTQSGFLSQGRLIRKLRMLLWFSILWVVLSQVSLIIHLVAEFLNKSLNFHWLEPGNMFGRVALVILMGVSFTVLDVVYITVVLNYAVQCMLLLYYIEGIQEKIREHTIELNNSMREMVEIQGHLRFLNHHPGTALSIVMINFGTMVITGLLAFFDHKNNNFTLLMYIATGTAILLWLSVMALPVILAARLTASCNTLRKIGHQVRVRPFGYQDESTEQLDSFLLYVATLRLKAKIFLIPVRSSYLCGVLVFITVSLILLFQTGVFRIWL